MLTIRDHMTLAFAGQRWAHPGARVTAIRDLFDETETRYTQRLMALLERPEAEAAYPQLVRRLRRLRDSRRVARSVPDRCAHVHI